MALNLTGKIELDGAGFERGLERAGDRVKEFVTTAAVAAFGFQGLEEAISKTVETATDLVNTAKRLDLTVEQLQVLRQAAKDGGTEMDALAGAFEKLNLARQKALSGNKDAIAAFTKLGIGQNQLQTQTAASLFLQPISSAVKSGSVEDLGPALKEILGKGFGELIPVLKEDFDELGAKMKNLGTIMDTETAVKLKTVGDEFDLLKNVLVVQLAPAILAVVSALLQFIGVIKSVSAFLGALSQKGITKAIGAEAQYFANGKDPLSKIVRGGLSVMFPFLSGDTVRKGLNQIVTPEEGKALMQGARDAFNDSDKESQAWLKEIQDKIAAQTEELKNPKPPAFQEPEDTSKTPKGVKLTGAAHIPTDALVKVGNFLGANGSTISRVEQRKLDYLKEIVKNTSFLPGATKGGGLHLFGLEIPV